MGPENAGRSGQREDEGIGSENIVRQGIAGTAIGVVIVDKRHSILAQAGIGGQTLVGNVPIAFTESAIDGGFQSEVESGRRIASVLDPCSDIVF